MNPLVTSATDQELEFIASLDYGQDAQQHFEALRALIFSQGGNCQEGQIWYPYEVIELGSHSLQENHEREFAICTLLVIHAVRIGFDRYTILSDKFSDRATEYDALPSDLRQELLREFEAADANQRLERP